MIYIKLAKYLGDARRNKVYATATGIEPSINLTPSEVIRI